jgi:hypothetical protein
MTPMKGKFGRGNFPKMTCLKNISTRIERGFRGHVSESGVPRGFRDYFERR